MGSSTVMHQTLPEPDSGSTGQRPDAPLGRMSTPAPLPALGAPPSSQSQGGGGHSAGGAVRRVSNGAPPLSFQAGLPPSPEYSWCGK